MIDSIFLFIAMNFASHFVTPHCLPITHLVRKNRLIQVNTISIIKLDPIMIFNMTEFTEIDIIIFGMLFY